jgi:hypothetical protein
LVLTRAGSAPRWTRLLETEQAKLPTLRVASDRAAYRLTDRATFVQLEGLLDLRVLFPIFSCKTQVRFILSGALEVSLTALVTASFAGIPLAYVLGESTGLSAKGATWLLHS